MPHPAHGTLCHSYSNRFVGLELTGLPACHLQIWQPNKGPSHLLMVLTIRDPDAFKGAQG